MVLVFSSVFMGIWNSDQKAMHSAIARNKRLQKPVAVFPIPPVETVRSENLLPVEFSVPEPRPVRVAMRASDDVGQSEPVIERHEEQVQHQTESEVPVVTLEPISEDEPVAHGSTIEAVEIPASVKTEAVVVEPVATEAVVPELTMTESEEVSSTENSVEEVKTEEAVPAEESSDSDVSSGVEPVVEMAEESVHSEAEVNDVEAEETPAETSVNEAPGSDVAVSETPVEEAAAEIEQSPAPAPEDFSVEVKASHSESKVAAETKSEVPRSEEVAAENVTTEAETVVTTEATVMVAENSAEETAKEHSSDVPVPSEQPITQSAESELPEPAEPIVEEATEHSDAVAKHDAESNATDANAGEAGEDEKSLEEKLLKSGEYDMLDVHSEDVTPGTVEPPLDGGATCIPLPRNLASGTWQVIHPSGEFFKITVDRGRNSYVNRGGDDEEILETSFCITAAPDGVRWCFIRSFVDSPAPVRRVTTEFFSPGQQ